MTELQTQIKAIEGQTEQLSAQLKRLGEGAMGEGATPVTESAAEISLREAEAEKEDLRVCERLAVNLGHSPRSAAIFKYGRKALGRDGRILPEYLKA